jgi:tRNA-specific 2-thiouridylase
VLVAADGAREVIGEHQGLHFFTIGQRKGIDIGGTGPFYVFEKDLASGDLLVTNDVDDPRLFASECVVEKMHWLVSTEDSRVQVGAGFECEVMIRYRQKPQPAIVRVLEEGKIEIEFKQPERAVTPGQSAVLYDGDVVLGGGIIS